jgi:hypothetical protein
VLFPFALPFRLNGRASLSGKGRALVGAALCTASAACSVTPESYTADEKVGSTQIVVAIARQESVDGGARADALAGFIRLPAATDRSAALELAGLGVHLPEVGHCWQGEPERSLAPLDEISTIEFLDAGRVRLIAGSGLPHELAPHAFPSVADFASGVLYASRERSGDGLPPGERYRLEAEGGVVGQLDLERSAPMAPSDVTLNGASFEAVARLQVLEPLDLIWGASTDPDDRIYLELSSTSSPSSLICTFEDAAGAATLSLENFLPGDTAQLALHRLRITRAASNESATDEVELRFDFSMSRVLEFQ